LDRLEDEDADCRVVMVTAAYPDFDVVEMPFDAYLIKPVDREELLDAVDRMLTRTTYSERVQRYYVLAEKVAALEANHTETELAESDVYQELVRNLDRARERAAESFATVAEEPLSPGLFDDI
ncbi:MAG: HalX domain-containing protein, partial [Halobacteriaceae archaeon]